MRPSDEGQIMPQDPVKKSLAADSRRTRGVRQEAKADAPAFIAHDHAVRVPGCHRCELGADEVAAIEALYPDVHWTLPLGDAEELWEYLHHYRPGGYQHVSDSLHEAIAAARAHVR